MKQKPTRLVVACFTPRAISQSPTMAARRYPAARAASQLWVSPSHLDQAKGKAPAKVLRQTGYILSKVARGSSEVKPDNPLPKRAFASVMAKEPLPVQVLRGSASRSWRLTTGVPPTCALTGPSFGSLSWKNTLHN